MVPQRRPNVSRFNMLLHGVPYACTDGTGWAVAFTSWIAGPFSRITVDYNDLPAGATRLVVAIWQNGLVEGADSHQLTFKTQYVPDQDTDIRIVVTYPISMRVRVARPRPTVEVPGLVAWEIHLQHQQRFMPLLTLDTTGH